jgi:hypothetical protein
MTATDLPSSTVLVSLNEKRHTALLESVVTGLCAELARVREERDARRAELEQLRQEGARA